jgi:hypothetical protein
VLFDVTVRADHHAFLRFREDHAPGSAQTASREAERLLRRIEMMEIEQAAGSIAATPLAAAAA